jgi:hypothetical protein
MKVINQESGAGPVLPWWVGKEARCKNCSAALVLEVGDPVREIVTKRFNRATSIEFSCTACGRTLSLEKENLLESGSLTKRTPQGGQKSGVMPGLYGYDFKQTATTSHLRPLATGLPRIGPELDSLDSVHAAPIPKTTAASRPEGTEPLEEMVKKPHQKRLLLGGLSLIGLVVLSLATVKILKVQNPQAAPVKTISREQQDELNTSQLAEKIQATVKAFFAATTVEEMSRYIRHPERVRPLMEKYYAKHPLQLNPVKRQSELTILEMLGKGTFWNQTVEFGNGDESLVLLQQLDTGETKVDWETTVCDQPMPWDDFVNDRPMEKSPDFRVYLQSDHFYAYEFADSTLWQCFRLKAFNSPEELYGYVKKDDPLLKEISEVIDRYRGELPTPILRLRFPKDAKAKRCVLIEKMLSPQWVYFDNASL